MMEERSREQRHELDEGIRDGTWVLQPFRKITHTFLVPLLHLWVYSVSTHRLVKPRHTLPARPFPQFRPPCLTPYHQKDRFAEFRNVE
jgi:hypothetical protein